MALEIAKTTLTLSRWVRLFLPGWAEHDSATHIVLERWTLETLVQQTLRHSAKSQKVHRGPLIFRGIIALWHFGKYADFGVEMYKAAASSLLICTKAGDRRKQFLPSFHIISSRGNKFQGEIRQIKLISGPFMWATHNLIGLQGKLVLSKLR